MYRKVFFRQNHKKQIIKQFQWFISSHVQRNCCCLGIQLALVVVLQNNFGQNMLSKSTKLNKICFSTERLTAGLSQLFRTSVKLFLLSSRVGILGFFLKFPNVLRSSLKSFSNSHIYFLVIIIQFRFTCGKGKLR